MIFFLLKSKILRTYGVQESILAAVRLLCTDTKAKVLSSDGETEFFEILAGVLQGDTRAPYILTIMLDYAMRHSIGNDSEEIGFKLNHKICRRHNPDMITDLDFADDIALVTEKMECAGYTGL